MATNPSPSAVRYGGVWPDGTIKLLDGHGNVLPHGTKVSVSGNHTTITNPDGSIRQVESGGAGLHVATPVTDALGMAGVDPALGYAAGAANRGLGYQEADYNTNYGGLVTNPDGSLSLPTDLGATNPDGSPKYGRALQDYFNQQNQINQQYGYQNQDLHTQYNNLADTQAQEINQAGLGEGGALAQALAKRTANEGVTQGRLDTAHNQSLADLLTQTTRGATDAYTGLQRAVGENAPYQATLQQQASMQAAPGLVGNPNYEVVGNSIYARQPNGTVAPVAKTATIKKKQAAPARTAFGRPMNFG